IPNVRGPIFLADLNGDGHVGVLSNMAGLNPTWLENNGALTPAFTPHQLAINLPFADTMGLASWGLADVNGDGRPDLYYITSSGKMGPHRLWLPRLWLGS